MIESKDWQAKGSEPWTRKQQNLFNAACQDLEEQLRFWGGMRFMKPDWRHLIAACVLGDRLVPGVNQGYGPPGLVRMARSSTEFTKTQGTEAIRMAFDIGDNPRDQGIDRDGIRWGRAVVLARFIVPDEAACAADCEGEGNA